MPTFQVIVLMSSEQSLDAMAARNGETRDEGEMARLINVPVLAPGCSTIFDRPPEGLEGDELAEWEANQFKMVRERLHRHHGVAFREYVDHLVADPDDIRRKALAYVARFEEKVATPTMSPVARDIVAKFGVL